MVRVAHAAAAAVAAARVARVAKATRSYDRIKDEVVSSRSHRSRHPVAQDDSELWPVFEG